MHTLLFAPATHRLGPVLTLVEVALACRGWCNPVFITFGGRFSSVVRELGLPLMELTPRLTPQRQQVLIALERGEARGELFSPEELASRVRSELEAYEATAAVGIVACGNLSTLISARAARLPLAWVTPLAATRAFWEAPSPYRAAALGAAPGWLPQGLRCWIAARAMLRGKFVGPFNQVARAMGTPRASNLLAMAEGPRDIIVLTDPPQVCPERLPEGYRNPGPIIPSHTPWQLPQGIEKSQTIVVLPSPSTPPRLLSHLLKSLARGPWNVLAPIRSLTHPPASNPKLLITSWIPALAACRQAKAVIACGGVSSIYTAIASTRPTIVVPGWHVPRVVGAMAEAEGLARTIAPAQLSPEALASAMESPPSPAQLLHTDPEAVSRTLRDHFLP